MDGERRGLWSRAGISLLNVIYPGLGLLRAGKVAMAIRFALASTATTLLMLTIFALPPVMTIAHLIAFIVVGVGIGFPVMLGSVVRTWHAARSRIDPKRLPSRWFVVLSLALAATATSNLPAAWLRRQYEPFESPSTSMSPTLQLYDYWLADMRDPQRLARGDVIVFRGGQAGESPTEFVKRVIGLPGDRVAVRGGILSVNGMPARGPAIAPRRSLGPNLGRLPTGSLYVERLPGGTKTYEVIDSIAGSAGDEFAEVIVPVGHVFVLGDNRDDSADSRLSLAEGGMGMVPITDVRGRALFLFWSRDRTRVGNAVQ